MQAKTNTGTNSARQEKRCISIMSKGHLLHLGFDEITHVSKYGNDTVIYTTLPTSPEGEVLQGTARRYSTCQSLQEILDDLPTDNFFRIHRSHIVSLKHMGGVEGNNIRVGEYYLPLSTYYRVQLISKLEEILKRDFIFFK
jgi:DNA-binding LytR/AlgR family response regulator